MEESDKRNFRIPNGISIREITNELNQMGFKTSAIGLFNSLQLRRLLNS